MDRTTQFRPARAHVLLLGIAIFAAGPAAADQVIADDLIVQGSQCIGFDCFNGETFNYTTLRLKENNTRLDFIDTSTISGYPNRDWRLEANQSSSGGANRFAIIDMGVDNATGVEAVGNPILQLYAGAPSNSLVVSSSGRLGIRTATPVLDVHVRSSNTPGMRFDQDGSGGFPPYVWDVAANEANFFIRDVTGGSRLPFRIRPGAPSNSLIITQDGFIGLGVLSPAVQLHTNGGVRFEDIPACSAGIKTNNNGRLLCITSSARFKSVIGELSPEIALANVMALKPRVGSYDATPEEPEHWLIAEETAEVDPALVGLKDGEPYTVKTQNVVADLIAVVQMQQRRIEALERKLAAQ